MPKKTAPKKSSKSFLPKFSLNRHVLSDIKTIWSYKVTKLLMGLLVLLLISPFIIAFSLNVRPADKIDYGVTFSAPYATSLGYDWRKMYIDILDDLRVNNFRLVAYWNTIEPEEGKYDFSELEWQVDEARKRDAKVILSIGRKVPRWPECHDPEWLGKKTLPEQEASTLKLLEALVTHFKGYENIKMWQVENEPYFPFGKCTPPRWEFINKELELVKRLDPSRPTITQDSGEGGLWKPTYLINGEYLGISMYRRIWYDFWGVFLGHSVFFEYPLSYWSYPLKARIAGIPLERVKVLELQAEPWGDGAVDHLSQDIKDKTMSKDKFLETISYAQKTGINTLYFWGVEWWYWEKYSNDNPFFWEASKAFWR
jgi:hypothetical protein